MVAITKIALGLIAVIASVIAAPAPSGNQYFVPAGASRGPCPAINIAANHGFLPRDGRGITVEILQQGLNDAFNFQPDFTAALFGILTNPTTGIPAPFNLEDLKQHTPFVIEHDASISRNDFANNANNFGFNRTLFANSIQYVRDLGFKQLDITAMAHIRHLRETQSRLFNPAFSFDRLTVNPDGTLVADPSKPEFFAIGEAAFVLNILGSQNTLTNPTMSFQQAALMFAKEALPSGYQPSQAVNTMDTTLARAAEIKQKLVALPPIDPQVAAKYWNNDFSKTLLGQN